MNKIVIAGCGPGHADYVSLAVHKAVTPAEVLVGAQHLLDLFPQSQCQQIVVHGAMASVLDKLAALNDKKICVLVSGDTGIFSLARLIINRFGRNNCQLIPGISSVQVAFARLALDWSDAFFISAHGRVPHVDSTELARYAKIALLAGDDTAVCWAADRLAELKDNYMAISCENLTLPTEKISEFATAESLRQASLPARTILLLLKKELLR